MNTTIYTREGNTNTRTGRKSWRGLEIENQTVARKTNPCTWGTRRESWHHKEVKAQLPPAAGTWHTGGSQGTYADAPREGAGGSGSGSAEARRSDVLADAPREKGGGLGSEARQERARGWPGREWGREGADKTQERKTKATASWDTWCVASGRR